MAYKLLIPVIIFALVLSLAWFLSYKFTLKLDFSQAFKTTPEQAPQFTGGSSFILKGVDGGHAEIGISYPDLGNSSEELDVTEKNQDEIKSSLNSLEIEQWEFLTNLPSSIFKFDIILSSYPSSPNNTKKASYYLVTNLDGTPRKVLPGERIMLAHNYKIDDIPTALSKLKIKLIYEGGFYQNFYDQNGDLISQATGDIIIKPTVFRQILIIFGAWVFIVSAFLLIKQTLMLSHDLKEIMDYFKSNS